MIHNPWIFSKQNIDKKTWTHDETQTTLYTNSIWHCIHNLKDIDFIGIMV